MEQFARPIDAYTLPYDIDGEAWPHDGCRRRGRGVIMRVTALHSRIGIPLVGGYGPAMAAMEALTRDLSAELAPRGIRVVGFSGRRRWSGSGTIREAFEPRAGGHWVDVGAVGGPAGEPDASAAPHVAAPTAAVAAFLASDRASGLTGTIVNLTMGSLDD